MTLATAATDPVTERSSFWKRRVVGPIVGQLRQGITADKVAITIALGFVLALFPILGATTLLCALAALFLKLNQPVIQMVNYVTYPLQLLLLIPFYRAGDTLFSRPHLPLSIPLLFERFRADVPKFLQDFGMIAVRGIVVWLLVAPLLAAALFYLLRPGLRALERKVAR